MTNRLKGLENTKTSQSVKPYSAFVRFLKLTLPLLAIGILSLLFLWPQLTAIKTEPLEKSDLKALKEAETENKLLNPVFNTEDHKGRPLTITADEATQTKRNDNIIELKTPSALLKNNGGQMTLEADHGQYDQFGKTITLHNNVTVRDSDNNLLETQTLTADIEKGTAQSDTPAKLTTPSGTIEGQKILLQDHGQKTIFQGPAKAVINPAGHKK